MIGDKLSGLFEIVELDEAILREHEYLLCSELKDEAHFCSKTGR